jgi:ABC-type polysaccharide/polyol phosphate export permease/Flp pilus assembly protein TadD
MGKQGDRDHFRPSSGPLRHAYRRAVVDENWTEAASLAQKIADTDANDAASQRLASHALARLNRIELALTYALRAFEIDPDDLSHRMHAGALMNRAEDFPGAIAMLSPALQYPDRPAELYHQLAVASEQMGNTELALEMAAAAWQRQPDRPVRGVFLANLHARRDQWSQAIDTLKSVEARCGSNPLIKRTLSGYLINTGDEDAALAMIDAAIREQPDRADFHIHRVGILRRMNRLDDARAAIERVMALAPGNLNLRRQAVTIYTESGDLDKALQNGAKLLAAAPDVEEYASCMRFLLDARTTSTLKAEIGDIAALKKDAPQRSYREPPTFLEQARSQANVIGALVLREIKARYGRNRLGFLWAIIGPFAHIGILAVVFSLSMRSNPPLGGNYFFYYYTGVMPYLLLTQVITQCGHAVFGNRGMLQLPDITPTDLLVAKAIVELFTMAVVLLIFAAIFVALGLPGIPDRPGPVLAAFALTWGLGLGLGAIYASFLEFGKLVETVFIVLIRATYFTSGIFFLPSAVPENLRVYLYWNPFVHLVDLSRAGYYPFYDGATTSPLYAGVVTLFVLSIGAIMLRVVSSGMRAQK